MLIFNIGNVIIFFCVWVFFEYNNSDVRFFVVVIVNVKYCVIVGCIYCLLDFLINRWCVWEVVVFIVSVLLGDCLVVWLFIDVMCVIVGN